MYMATMSSTSHGLSVWANSCVKRPINSKTGLSSTSCDRDDVSIKYDDALKEVENKTILFTTPEANNTTTTGDLVGLDEFESCARSSPTSIGYDDKMSLSKGNEFYEKLQQLKEENKKTLKSYESLYHDKILLECMQMNKSYEIELDKSDIVATDPMELSVKGESSYIFTKPEVTVVSKPPPGKPRETALYTPIPSKTLPQKSTQFSKMERPNSAPTERRSHSLDHEHWHQIFSGLRESSDNFIIPQGDNSSKVEKALAKVDKLWKDFKISEYGQQRRHSLSFSRDNNKIKSDDVKTKSPEWRHRITIPQPFKMSVREALKEKKKTSTLEELEQRRLVKQKQEEAECEKKFKAQPVPSHVYLPLFEEIMERNETRRKYVKQICQELLQSEVKPFNFEIREQQKKLQRAHSAPIRRPEKTSNNFKAKPIPRHIFSPDIDEKLLEEEELRKIRVKMRSRELLHESSLPPNMALREKLKEQERKEKLKLAKQAKKKRQIRSIHDIPDYDYLYNEFKKELARRRSVYTGTVAEPFNLQTKYIRSNKDKITKDIEDNENRLKEKRWPFQNSKITPRSSMKYLGALSDSLDYIPTQSTRSAELRSTVIMKEKDRLVNHQKEEEQAEKRRKAREAKLRKYLTEKTNSAEIPKPRDSVAERLKKIRKDDRERQEAYEREIEEMNARIEQSPLLVEKYTTEYTKKAAEKKFTAALHSAGLDDQEFIISTTKPPTSVRSGNVSADHDGDNINDQDRTASHHDSDDFTNTKSPLDD